MICLWIKPRFYFTFILPGKLFSYYCHMSCLVAPVSQKDGIKINVSSKRNTLILNIDSLTLRWCQTFFDDGVLFVFVHSF